MKADLNFEQQLAQSIQHTVIDFIRKGEWLKLDYNARINLDSTWLKTMHSQVDMNQVIQIVKSQVEQKMADHIMNSMATEIGTDIKSIMSNQELREDIRSTIRAKIRETKQQLG
jgi:nucleoid-associated protein YejK